MNYKLLFLALLSIESSCLFAGTMGAAETRSWEVEGHALYLKSFIGDNNLTFLESSQETIGSVSNTFGAGLNYSWGFQLGAAYHFNSVADVRVDWYHLRSGSRASRYMDESGNWVSPAILHTGETLQSGNYYFSNAPAWDAVNMELGEVMPSRSLQSLRIHAGMEYARVANNSMFDGNFIASAPGSTLSRDSLNFNAVYNGFGPRLGVNFTQALLYDFDVYAKGAGAILAGTNKSDANVTNVNALGQTVNYSEKTSSFTAVVPTVDAQLGFQYTYALSRGELVLNAEWLWVTYFDALRSSNGPTASLSNVGFEGVVFGAKWNGNFA